MHRVLVRRLQDSSRDAPCVGAKVLGGNELENREVVETANAMWRKLQYYGRTYDL